MVSSDFFVLHINLKGENKMGNLIQYIIQEDPEKNQPWQTPMSQNNSLNSFTRNLYKRMNDKFLGGIYQKKQDELEKLSKQENLEKPYKYSNYAIDIGVNGAKAFNLIKKGIIKRKRTE